jgi:Domain of unknown function (DUF4434)
MTTLAPCEVDRRAALIGLANCLVCAKTFDIPDASADEGCRLRGTFIQLTNEQAAWSSSDWRRLFDEFETLGITNLFMQWTVLDRTAFFPTIRFRPSSAAAVPLVLNFAARAKICVWIGLHLDTHYWEEIKQGPDRIQTYFRGRLRDLDGLLAELDPVLAVAPFAGWYVTDELDDQTWQDGAKRTVLKQYLSDTVAQLRARRSASRIAISGFTNSSSDPNVVATFWADVLKASAIDLLLFQDGVGEKKLQLSEVPGYYASLLGAVQGVGAELGGVVELFTLVPDGKRLPGDSERIRRQLALADRMCGFPPVAFSVPDYMSALAGPQAADLLSQFISARGMCPP